MKTTQDNITTHLLLSKNTGLAIHIKLKNCNSYFITCIENMINGKIMANPISLHGAAIETPTFSEGEIEIARCLNVNYDAPFYVQLRAIKENIRFMKDYTRQIRRR
jgi:hypothetical protein